MSKNKKKYDREHDEQFKLINEMNNVFFTGASFDISPSDDYDDEDFDVLDIFKDVEAELDARLNDSNDDTDDEDDWDEWAREMVAAGRPDDGCEETEESHGDVEICPPENIYIEYIDSDVKIAKISDGVKSVCIDINALDSDNDEYDYTRELLEEGRPLYEIAKVRLVEILTNFYPAASMTIDMMNDDFWNVSSMDEQSFYFIRSFFDDNIIFGYYIPLESLKVYEKIITDIINMNKFRSFLTYIYDATSTQGFAFANLGQTYIRQRMMFSSVNAKTERFIRFVLDDADTMIDTSLSHDVRENESFPIYPFYFKNDGVDAYIADIDDDEDDDSYGDDEDNDLDESSENENDEADDEIVFNIKSEEPEQEDVIDDEVMNDDSVEAISDPEPVQEESKESESEFSDLFESDDTVESSEPVEQTQEQKPVDDDDKEYIVQRRL